MESKFSRKSSDEEQKGIPANRTEKETDKKVTLELQPRTGSNESPSSLDTPEGEKEKREGAIDNENTPNNDEAL